MFRNRGGQAFSDVTTATGTATCRRGTASSSPTSTTTATGHLHNLGGAFPGDKYPDALFENPGHGNDWLAVRLVGVTNRAAMGAQMRVNLAGVASGSRLRYREVSSGGSFGANSFMQHIGLGPATIESVEIAWPASKTRQTFRDVPVNSFLEIREGESTFKVRTPRRVTLGAGASGTTHQH